MPAKWNAELEFKPSRELSIGVELELQILNSRDYNLARGAGDLLALLERTPHPGAVKPEITESMIEINSVGAHGIRNPAARAAEDPRCGGARRPAQLNLRIAGGGSHPFHKWSDRRIYPTERFKHLLSVYGYLAKQFTVFGQHIHVGVPDGDTAIYLSHALSRYIPHFIALSASSPFQQGTDTDFQSSRLNTVSAFPLSGTLPLVIAWSEFVDLLREDAALRHRREHEGFLLGHAAQAGIRHRRDSRARHAADGRARRAARGLCADTRALPTRAAAVAEPSDDVYLVYRYNRFQACRYGVGGAYIDAQTQQRGTLQRDILNTLEVIAASRAQLDRKRR